MKTHSLTKLTSAMKRQPSRLKKATVQCFIFIAAITGFILPGFAEETVITNPTSPWTVPAGVTSIKVEVWGGGGGGGAAGSFIGTFGGGGGGGGAYNVATLSVTPGHTFTITIGSGGTAGSGNAGGTGGITTVSGIDGTVSANGGGGGGYGGQANGSAGAASTGGFNNGGQGGASGGNGAGGGGGAGNATPIGAGNGGAGSNTGAGTPGIGNPNTSPYAGGAGAAAKTSNGTGNTGSIPGGGGGGGRAGSFSSNNGGAGAAGQVVITYTACPTITPAITYADVSCFNGNNGSITVTGVTGGTGTYQYSINNGSNYTAASVPPYTFTNLVANTVYKVRVKDANGCESSIIP